jgi:hypothetical protein
MLTPCRDRSAAVAEAAVPAARPVARREVSVVRVVLVPSAAPAVLAVPEAAAAAE